MDLCPLCVFFCLLYGISPVHRDICARSQPHQPTKGAIKKRRACMHVHGADSPLAHGISPVTESR